MSQALIDLLIIATVAGLAIPLGGLLCMFHGSHSRRVEQEIRHTIMALGAGALVSAVALVLVPQGLENTDLPFAIGCFVAGAVAFMGLDVWLAKHKTKASQLAAMLSDFVPESIALGTAAALGHSTFLLGLLIALQNLPEGFSAFREQHPRGRQGRLKVLGIFVLLAFIGPIMGVFGYFVFSDYPVMVSGLMLFAAGGILYSVFQDIAPNIPLKKHWLPPFGAIVGFALGMVGFMLEQG